MRNKADRNDARGIAQMMRLGWYGAVHVKNIEMQKMHTLLANRKLLKRKLAIEAGAVVAAWLARN
jgi:transposase